jgi:hypothetical protein
MAAENDVSLPVGAAVGIALGAFVVALTGTCVVMRCVALRRQTGEQSISNKLDL